MALSDFLNREAVSSPSNWKGTPFKVEATETAQNALEEADNGIAIAQRNSENRMKADRIRKQIENLKAQNEALRQQKESIKQHSLSELDEDEVVRLAKSRGIRDEDVTQWLNARIARTNREVSQGQKAEMGRVAEAEAAKAKEIEEANKSELESAIRKARLEYERANVAVPAEGLEAKKAELDVLETDFNELVKAYEKKYGDSVGYKLTPRRIEDGSLATVPPLPEGYDWTEVEKTKWADKTTTEKERDEMLAVKKDAAEKKAGAKERAEKELKKKRDDLKAEAKGDLSEAGKRDLVTRYRNTFKENKPTRAETYKILFGGK